MADKTYLGNEINFNQAPVMWAGLEVYPGNGATSNLYGTLNVIKNPNEKKIPDINTDGNLTVNKSCTVEAEATFNNNVTMNKILDLANCGNVAKRIDRADRLPSSDRNLKTNITPIENALDKVLQLNGVEFDFINEKYCGHLKQHQIGLIAQEVQEIIPEVVGENNDGTLGVSYQHLIAILIEAIKDQQKQIDELKNNK